VRVFSYIVSRDYGFAPNPFHGYCSLATCKPAIKRVSCVGDFVVGTGSTPHGLAGHLVYAMRISEKLSFAEFWAEPRFRRKRPNLRGNTRDAYGDNIYEPAPDGSFIQHNSHHSLACGGTNLFNRNKDTGTNAILISNDFVYFGGSGPPIPTELRNYRGYDLCASTQGHLSRFPPGFVELVESWFEALPVRGVQGLPADWD
jgi:hypothetical protein